jgi:DNA transformation protein and related proteins
MAPSADFLDFLNDQLRGLGHITTRRMFSGAGVYCDGMIFALILRDTLYFKVDDGNRGAFEAEGLQPFSYDGRGKRVELPYWQVPERLFDEPDEMLDWARGALGAARRAGERKKPKARGKRPRS